MIAITTAASASGFVALLLPDWRAVAGLLPVLLLALSLQPLLRSVLRRQLWRHGLWGTDAVILADPEMGPQVADYFREHWEFGLVPAPRAQVGSADARPPVAVLAARAMPPREELATLLRDFEWIIVLADLPSLRISGLQPDSLGGRIGITLRGRRAEPAYHLLRRFVDLTIAVLALVLLAPVMAVAALAIWIVDPGPVIYRQAREGAQGRTLHLLKLRTMYRDAEKRLEELLSSDPALQAEWEAHFKLKKDPRILPLVGQFLRSSSCDELPQLFNVIAGDMSIVGPRPFPEYHLAAMGEEFRAKRRSVMPGLTGLWQVASRSTADVRLQQQLDEFYIDNRSFWFDGHIILRTFRAVLGRNGAY